MFNTLKELFEKVDFEKPADDNKQMKNYPAFKDFNSKNSESNVWQILFILVGT